MREQAVEALIRADARLTRSFVAAVAAVLASLGWSLFIEPPRPGGGVSVVPLVLLVLQIASYLWYAISAGAAAKLLGAKGPMYVAWILAAPFLALLPIPIVSTIIGVSPLSIKFLLGGQLQTAIREASFAELHGTS